MLFSANSPSDSPEALPPASDAITAEPLHRVRANGRIVVTSASRGGRSRVTNLEERGGYRLRFPRRGGTPSGILINTGGGLCSGDRLTIDATAEEDAALELTTQAAERIYRSGDGATAVVTTKLSAAHRSTLRWLPQETILFERSRLSRRFDVALSATATFLATETLVFGRAAFGETLTDISYQDQWRIRRGGQLIYADAIRLDGNAAAELARPAIGSGTRVFSLVVFSAPGASEHVERLRRVLDIDAVDGAVRAGVTGWGDLLMIRALSASTELMRGLTVRAISELSGAPPPRAWNT